MGTLFLFNFAFDNTASHHLYVRAPIYTQNAYPRHLYTPSQTLLTKNEKQGFSYGLLDTLNKHFQLSLGITRARSSGLQAAYFGAYPLASLGHANWILRHYGYKAVFIWGLILYGVGSLVAWPCLLKRSFGGFCAAIFIIGNGLGSLETAANPYLTVCGPPRYAEIRINVAQAFNGIGTVVAPVLASYVFFKDTGDDVDSMKNVQWTYLAIAVFVFLLAGVFYLTPIPEITVSFPLGDLLYRRR